MQLDEIRSLVSDEMAAVDQFIDTQLNTNIDFITEVGRHIIESGGKRLRPMLVLLSAKAFDYQGDGHVRLAAVIEFIHTATLLHDDVVDASDLRRGKKTANAMWGNEASVLVGDFLYSRSFQIMVGLNSMRVMGILAQATNTIAEGEVLQLLNCNDAATTEERYFEVIRYKTATLFEAASKLGATLAQREPWQIDIAAKYGMHLGMAFQMIDDALDYQSSSEEMGKSRGDDLAKGKPTLPLIYALQHGSKEQQAVIKHAIEQGRREDLDAISKTIHETNAIDYTFNVAKQQIDIALDALQEIPPSPYRDAMQALAEFSLQRTY